MFQKLLFGLRIDDPNGTIHVNDSMHLNYLNNNLKPKLLAFRQSLTYFEPNVFDGATTSRGLLEMISIVKRLFLMRRISSFSNNKISKFQITIKLYFIAE